MRPDPFQLKQADWRQRAGKAIPSLLVGLVVLLFWQLLIIGRPSLEFLLGSPLGILNRLWTLLWAGDLFFHGSITGTEAVLGYVSGSTLGTALGLSFWWSRNLALAVGPYLAALGATPVFALGPILIFWFGTGITSKVVLGFLTTLGIAVFQSYRGAESADPNLVRLTTVLGGGRWDIFSKIVAPSALVWVLAGARLNIGMALLGAFIGEFVSSNKGLGHLIIVYEGLYDVNGIWAGVFCIGVLAIVFQAALYPVERFAGRLIAAE